MNILGIESTAVAASCALLKDGRLIGENYTDNALTHSVTLLPMIDALLNFCKLTLDDIDLIALAAGPGSFTGLRIGAATVKGLAFENTKCIGVSTLEAMAFDHTDYDGVICACMDARCSQLYNAMFECENGKLKRMCEDRAVSLDELSEEIKNLKKSVLLIGDGAKVCYNKLSENKIENVKLASASRILQHASGVCFAAQNALKNGNDGTAADGLMINYLRLPQAERMLSEKRKNK